MKKTISKPRDMDENHKILNELERLYKGGPFLSGRTPFERLIAVILSAQCTDAQVNKVTKELFKKYRTPKAFANADIKELEKLVYSTGFYRAKARYLKETSQIILDRFGGKVPDKMEDLLQLRGVARKVANIIMWEAHSKISGIPVDTHVKRVSYRLGLTQNTNPDKIEQDLINIYPEEKWPNVSYMLIEHGRAVCDARNPNCKNCTLANTCPKNGVN